MGTIRVRPDPPKWTRVYPTIVSVSQRCPNTSPTAASLINVLTSDEGNDDVSTVEPDEKRLCCDPVALTSSSSSSILITIGPSSVAPAVDAGVTVLTEWITGEEAAVLE